MVTSLAILLAGHVGWSARAAETPPAVPPKPQPASWADPMFTQPFIDIDEWRDKHPLRFKQEPDQPILPQHVVEVRHVLPVRAGTQLRPVRQDVGVRVVVASPLVGAESAGEGARSNEPATARTATVSRAPAAPASSGVSQGRDR